MLERDDRAPQNAGLLSAAGTAMATEAEHMLCAVRRAIPGARAPAGSFIARFAMPEATRRLTPGPPADICWTPTWRNESDPGARAAEWRATRPEPLPSHSPIAK